MPTVRLKSGTTKTFPYTTEGKAQAAKYAKRYGGAVTGSTGYYSGTRGGVATKTLKEGGRGYAKGTKAKAGKATKTKDGYKVMSKMRSKGYELGNAGTRSTYNSATGFKHGTSAKSGYAMGTGPNASVGQSGGTTGRNYPNPTGYKKGTGKLGKLITKKLKKYKKRK